jgi:LuxR family transcriptional regulator, maltose regulon positive regulatory protein
MHCTVIGSDGRNNSLYGSPIKMIAPSLATKLYIPLASAQVVLRPRLFDRLSKGLQRKLTLILAPAGFGKTTLMSARKAGLPACG